MRTIRPHEIVRDRQVVIIDVRAPDERTAGVGLIPGSRNFPRELLEIDAERLFEEYDADVTIALVCQSGKRSGEIRDRLVSVGFADVRNLEGGVLGWCADGLPTSALATASPANVPEAATIQDAARHLRSCFVAETVENALEGIADMDGFDPRAAFERFLAEELRYDALSGRVLLRVLDRLAEAAFRRGYPLERIAENVDRMLRLVEQVDPDALF